MGYYDLNIKKLLLQVTPPLFRRGVFMAFLYAMAAPLIALFSRFLDKKSESERVLSFNAYTIYLEKFLNDLFNLDGEIYIHDFRDDVFVYLPSRGAGELYFASSGDDETPFIPNYSSEYIYGRFNIHIPSSIDTDANKVLIARWANYFKFAGTNFNIITDNNG